MVSIPSRSARRRSSTSMSIAAFSSMRTVHWSVEAAPDGQDHDQGSETELLSQSAARRGLGAQEADARSCRWRRLRAARAFGLRKDDAAQSRFRLAQADRGPDLF